MSAVIHNNFTSPIMQEAFQLLGKLNENQLIVIVNSIKSFIEQNSNYENEHGEIREKKEAFAELLQLRDKFAATEPKSLEQERLEAMAGKYSFLRDDVKL